MAVIEVRILGSPVKGRSPMTMNSDNCRKSFDPANTVVAADAPIIINNGPVMFEPRPPNPIPMQVSAVKNAGWVTPYCMV